MTASAISTPWSVSPWWAQTYFRYFHSVPAHRGKAWALRKLLSIGIRGGTPFVWRMRNGNSLAISPHEGTAAWSVGWTCFLKKTWEPHVERLLNRMISPGQAVMDIGANLGYFSTVMARATGPGGKVWAFEPVPPTYQQLLIAKAVNGLNQLDPLPFALGSAPGELTIHYRRDIMGSASAHLYRDDPKAECATVKVCKLDDLYASGSVGAPSLIKIDIEGHELAALTGAVETIRAHTPAIVFEYHAKAAGTAGWQLADLSGLLRSCGLYQFYRIHEDHLEPVEPESVSFAPSEYTDFLASTASQAELSARYPVMSQFSHR